MGDIQVGAQQLMVEGGIAGLGVRELLRKKSKGLPGSASAKNAPLLQGGCDVGGRAWRHR